MGKVNNVDEKIFNGIALQHGDDYEFPCPICESEVEVDDFETAYRCDGCKCAIRFDIADIKVVAEREGGVDGYKNKGK